jgi:hypothetical protein
VNVVARRRAFAAAIAAGIALVVVVLLVVGGGGGGGTNAPIAEGAAKLVPDDALVWVHVSTDGERAAVQRAHSAAGRFPSYDRVRKNLLQRLSVGSDAVQGWLGKEAGLALLDSPSGTAASLVVLGVRDAKKARAFVTNGRPTETYSSVQIYRYGSVSSAFVNGFVILGQPDALHRAINLADGEDPNSLATVTAYQKALSGLPADRVIDAYATSGGVRRLLDPAGGVLGAAGTLLDRPGLQVAGLSLSVEEGLARLDVHSLSAGGGKAAFPPFDPKLIGEVPSGVLAYVGVRGFDTAVGRLLGLAGGALTQVFAKVQPLLAPLKGEVALFATSRAPAPIFTAVAAAPDQAAVRRALAKLGGRRSQVAGVGVTTVRSGAVSLSAAAYDGKLVLSTAPQGIAAARTRRGSLTGDAAFRSVVGSTAGPLTSLVFLDFDQLLRLGEQTGLNDSRAYQAVRDDLRQVRAVGARSAGGGGDTTAEIRFRLR